MSRIQISLPAETIDRLRALADQTGEPVARVAARLLLSGLTAHGGDQPLVHTRLHRRRQERDGRPAWLEPYGGDPRWRSLVWGSIVALVARYPKHLQSLRDGWWEDSFQTEMLCAMATWRDQIDAAGQDPRDELAFHHQLVYYAEMLRQTQGSVTNLWRPGAPPDEWAG
jgi:hypothetical protein